VSRRALRADEKQVLALLGLPTAALALAITVVTTYLPVVVRDELGSTAVIGGLIGLEGVMALWVPLVVGAWSDQLRTPLGGRLPFLVAAGVTAATMGVFVYVARRRRRERLEREDEEPHAAGRSGPRELLALLRDRPELRHYLLANGLWEGSLSALKTFVFLFVVTGVGLSESAAAGIIGAVALVALVGAPISGALGDRIGRLRVMRLVLPVYGLGLLVPAFTQAVPAMVPTMLLVGFAGGLVMTLPYAILQPLMPRSHHGALTGFYSLSRGVGAALGPLLAGLAIQLLGDPFASTDGYAAMWLVCGGTILLSLLPTHALARRVGDV
jgi:MFS family permease